MSAPGPLPPLDAFFGVFPGAVDATVTPKGGQGISTRVGWHGPFRDLAVGSVTGRGSDQVPALRPQMSVRRDEVATLPIGSTISAPLPNGGAALTWIVERVDDLDAEVFNVVVEAA